MSVVQGLETVPKGSTGGNGGSIRALARETRDVYDRNGVRFDAGRPKDLRERLWLDRFLDMVPPGGAILDAGCGAGDPIARHLIERGHAVTGIDFSTTMLDMAKARLPRGRWLHADMRDFDLGTIFAGIIGWNSFFHLTQDEQRSTLARFGDHLAPNGALMLTVGPRAGEVEGCVGEGRVYHSSLSPAEYESALAELGMEVVEFVPEDRDCYGLTILLARKWKRRRRRGRGSERP